MKKRVWIIIAVVLLLAVVGVVLYFSLRKASGEKFLQVKIGTNMTNNQITMSSSSKTLVPNATIIDKRIEVFADKDSSNVFVRAKIIFESDSEDNRVLSFVSQLNKYVGENKMHSEDSYSWKYIEEDNAFYLIKSGEDLKVVSSSDLNYLLLDKLTVPSKIEQIGYLNDSGANVQIGEDIRIRIIFESVQSNFIAEGNILNISNVREYFNRTSYVYENGFTALNGYITSCSTTSKSLVLPKYVQDEFIIGIKSNAFKSTTLENVIIAASYNTIENNAFAGCTNLKFVNIKNYIPVSLSDSSFSFSANLKIYVPNISCEKYEKLVSTFTYKTCVKTSTLSESTSLEGIDKTVEALYLPNIKTLTNQTFEGFTNLKYVYIPYLEKVEINQFRNLSNLLDVEIPNATIVNNNAFQNCSNLLTISLSKNLQSIGEYSFNLCSNLKNINFISNLTEIPNSAFRYCTSITKVTLNANAVSIGTEAFANSSLSSIKIKNLGSINASAFSACSGLNFVRIDGGTSPIIEENAFQSSNNAQIVFTNSETKNSLSNLTSSFGTKVILINVKNGAITRFEGSINSLTLSNIFDYSEISSIQDKAFESANIRHLYLGSNIKAIGKSAFANSTINNVYLNSYKTIDLTTETFLNVVSNFTLKVPSGVISIYKSQLSGINIESL